MKRSDDDIYFDFQEMYDSLAGAEDHLYSATNSCHGARRGTLKNRIKSKIDRILIDIEKLSGLISEEINRLADKIDADNQ